MTAISVGDVRVERRGDGERTSFVIWGRRRHEIYVADRRCEIASPDLGDDAAQLSAIVEGIWTLAEPGVVDEIAVSARVGDPNETTVVRRR